MKGVLTDPIAGPWNRFGREQLPYRAGGAQEKQVLIDSTDPPAAVSREWCVCTDVMCLWSSDRAPWQGSQVSWVGVCVLFHPSFMEILLPSKQS